MVGTIVVVASSKENGTKGEVSYIDGDEKTCLSSFRSNGWAGLGLVSGLDTVQLPIWFASNPSLVASIYLSALALNQL